MPDEAISGGQSSATMWFVITPDHERYVFSNERMAIYFADRHGGRDKCWIGFGRFIDEPKTRSQEG